MSPRRHVRGISDLVVAGGGEELSEQAREWSEAEAEVVSPSTVIAACPAGKCDAIRPIPIGRSGPGTPCSVRRLLCLSSEALFTPCAPNESFSISVFFYLFFLGSNDRIFGKWNPTQERPEYCPHKGSIKFPPPTPISPL